MKHSITLGDYLSEAQLRTLVKDYQVEQKYRGSRSPRRRQSSLSEVAAIRERVQRQRHNRHDGRLPHKSYLSEDDAIRRYEARGERLESGEQMFFIGQGERSRKHTDIRVNVIRGGRGGKICRRPAIEEEKCSRTIRVRPVSPLRLTGTRV